MGANAATPANVQPAEKVELTCGECGSYSKLQEKRAAPKYERDHIPAKATLREAAFKRAGGVSQLSDAEQTCIKNKVEARGITIAIPKECHRTFSPTCGSKNTKAQIDADSETPESLAAARDRDLAEMPPHLDPECQKAYATAAQKVKEHDNEKMIKQVIKECVGD
jgi:hypothetical protein